MNESLTIRRSKSMIRELKLIIRGLKGRNKAMERGEDILEKKVLWPDADNIDEWAWLNEDKKSLGFCSIILPQ